MGRAMTLAYLFLFGYAVLTANNSWLWAAERSLPPDPDHKENP